MGETGTVPWWSNPLHGLPGAQPYFRAPNMLATARPGKKEWRKGSRREAMVYL